MEKINNVEIDNGYSKHQLQYVQSPKEIISAAYTVTHRLEEDIVKEINEKGIKLLIKTNSDYSMVEYSELITDDYDLKHRFNENHPRS
ncbi:hypothetical protein [Confluentibacter flavum]|uniref:Uncharacterized protein n=1 Tax=Confluentibacter flavum TaxID=1909700 RepID=A0A2N3HP78_9FLAO|nr:hypothetical protein [Confluentibacter flavum]PKQ46410.1 hypothetical protein CSW08_04415 [Confluentibacter flavum]PKQ46664.1 hypothetical protein CSW08_01775 [Confluentibacter flavum]